jgi:hypothetical protein
MKSNKAREEMENSVNPYPNPWPSLCEEQKKETHNKGQEGRDVVGNLTAQSP